MRYLLISLTILFLSSIQDLIGQDRNNKFWVDGALGATIAGDFGSIDVRGGYFFTERLLVGTGLASEVTYFAGFGGFDANLRIAPFVRYYMGTGRWRPYAEASAGFLIYSGVETSAELVLGVEKEVASGVLANLELTYGINDILSTDLRLGLNFSALLNDVDSRFVAGSQLRKGNWSYGTQPISIGYLRRNGLNLEGYNLNISPEVAYFLSDRLILDLGVNLSYSKIEGGIEFTTGFDDTQSNLGFNGGLRGYFSTDKKINLFVQAGMEFNRLSENSKRINTTGVSEFDLTETQFDAILILGGTIFMNQNTSLDFGIRTTFDLSDNNNGRSSVQPALFAAFRFWGKKKK